MSVVQTLKERFNWTFDKNKELKKKGTKDGVIILQQKGAFQELGKVFINYVGKEVCVLFSIDGVPDWFSNNFSR